MKLAFYFIVFLYYTNTVSAQDWIGFGKGTSYLIVDGNKAKVNTCNCSFPIRFQEFDLGEQRVEVFDSATGDLYTYLSMEVMGLNMDSVKVFSIDGELLGAFFNEKTQLPTQNVKIRSIEYEVNDDLMQLYKKYQIFQNPYSNISRLYVHDSKLNKIDERILTIEQSAELQNLLLPIDFENIDHCSRQGSFVHADDHVFTFTDFDNRKYSFADQDPPLYLQRLRVFIKSIVSSAK